MGLFSGPALDVATAAVTGVNEIVTLNPVSGVLSVTSVAVKVTLSAVLSVTVKVAVPVASVIAVRRRHDRVDRHGDQSHRLAGQRQPVGVVEEHLDSCARAAIGRHRGAAGDDV